MLSVFLFLSDKVVALSPADTISLISRTASSCESNSNRTVRIGYLALQQLLKFSHPPLLGWFHANEASFGASLA